MGDLVDLSLCYHPIVGDKGLSGLIHNELVPAQSTVLVGSTRYKIITGKLVEFTLFTANGKLSVIHNGDRIRDQQKIKAFLLSCGLSSKELFINKFFRKPVIVGTNAMIVLWYLPFKENTYF